MAERGARRGYTGDLRDFEREDDGRESPERGVEDCQGGRDEQDTEVTDDGRHQLKQPMYSWGVKGTQIIGLFLESKVVPKMHTAACSMFTLAVNSNLYTTKKGSRYRVQFAKQCNCYWGLRAPSHKI